jgi:hypothetical protein
MTQVAVLDDYQGVALQMADWSVLSADCQVRVFRDHLTDRDALVGRLRDFEVITCMRERTPFPRDLLERPGPPWTLELPIEYTCAVFFWRMATLVSTSITRPRSHSGPRRSPCAPAADTGELAAAPHMERSRRRFCQWRGVIAHDAIRHHTRRSLHSAVLPISTGPNPCRVRAAVGQPGEAASTPGCA